MAYKLLTGGCIRRLSNGDCIQPDPGNNDYRAYLAWVGAGNTPEAADPPPLTPNEVARRAAIQALIDGDGTVALLLTQTPAEYDAWWLANATTVVQLSGILKRVVRILLRRLFL